MEALELRVGRIEGAGFTAEDLAARVRLAGDGPQLDLRAGVVGLPGATLRAATLACERLREDDSGLHCPRGRVAVAETPAGPLAATLDLHHQGPETTLTLDHLRLWGATATATLGRNGARWRVSAAAAGLDLTRWAEGLAPWLPLAAAFQPAGRGALTLAARGQGAEPETVTLAVQAREAAFASPDGLQAGERLGLDLDLELTRDGPGWSYGAHARLGDGAVYADPWYVEAGNDGLTVRAGGRYRGDGITLESLVFRQPRVLEGEARGDPLWSSARGPRGGRVQLTAPDLAPLYATWLQPLATGTPLDRLEVSGSASAEVTLAAGRPQALRVELRDLYADDRDRRFGVYRLAGTVAWDRDDHRPTTLTWDGGHLWRLDLGPGRFAATSRGARLALTEPLTVPVMDGAAVIDTLELDLAADDGPRGQLGGYLEPLSMTALSHAFGWPVFQGKVSGVLPRVTLADRRVALDGALLMRVFDGEVVLRDLVLNEPFGVVPELRANIDIRNLDLAPLTGAFSFGLIEGRLEGRVHDLVLQNWQPVAFDARLQTPPGDTSRHRISQRAVDSLTRIGGGAGISGALFLGLFKTFRYDTLGLGCRLERGACTMTGVGPAEDGYYLVEGAGLPRIDVIGYHRKVDWNILVQRLQRVTQTGPALVE